MKFNVFLVFLILAFPAFSQQVGDGKAININDLTVPLKSGIYEALNPVGTIPDLSYNGYQHLLVMRHSNEANNHELQIASSFTSNDRLFFRKAANYNLTSVNPTWYEIATRGVNNFIGNQSISANLGIGVINPQAGLDIYKSYDLNTTKAIKIMYQGSWGTAQYASNYRFIDIQSTEEGNIFALNAYGMGIGFNPPPYSSPDKLYINGNVGIGTTTPDAKLAVNGTIHSKEVKVDMLGWPDYVFKKEYNLPTLQEVEKHITEKGHLENIPSEEEVLKNGINLGEMDAKLLQKIEEMTLYMIEQNKRMDKMEKENNELKNNQIQFNKTISELTKNR